jgi:hypothetical protein
MKSVLKQGARTKPQNLHELLKFVRHEMIITPCAINAIQDLAVANVAAPRQVLAEAKRIRERFSASFTDLCRRTQRERQKFGDTLAQLSFRSIQRFIMKKEPR